MAGLPTFRGQVTVQDALDEDDDVLAQLRYPEQQKAFWASLAARRADIEALVRYHLGIDWCYVCAAEIWKAGSFNVVLAVLIRAKVRRGNERVYFRFPLPYKLGEADNPGNVEEKLRTEIATYTWLQEHCPDVPIPVLHGFGLPDGTCQNNIFVDDQWNIQTIIDLEWAQSQPLEMQLPPYWLTSKSIDAFDDTESVSELGALFNASIDIYETEEMAMNGALLHGHVMRHVWETGSFWYFHAIKVPKGMYRVFNSNIQPLFNEDHCHESIFDRVFFWYWGSGAQELIERKIQDRKEYEERIKKTFGKLE